jgi:hypothetical protein
MKWSVIQLKAFSIVSCMFEFDLQYACHVAKYVWGTS